MALLSLAVVLGICAGTASAATIGYVYSTSLAATGDQLQGFSLGEHGELDSVTGVKLTDSYGVGVAVAPTASGVYVYALSTPTPGSTSNELDIYKADTTNGSLVHIGELAVANACHYGSDPGLLVVDEGGAGPVELFVPGCEYPGEGATVGLKTFAVDTETGIPTESVFIHEKETGGFFGVGLAGNQITYIFEQHGEAFLQPLTINTTSGVVEGLPAVGLSGGPKDKEKAYVGAATTDRFAAGGFSPEEITQAKGVAQFEFDQSFAEVTPFTHGVTALAYSSAALIAGEEGPQVEFLTIGSGAAFDTVNLTEPPTDLAPYVQPDGDAIISIYTLGPFVYLGIYGGGVVQMIDEAGKPITFPEDPFAAGGADISINAMDGFLTAAIPPQGTTGGNSIDNDRNARRKTAGADQSGQRPDQSDRRQRAGEVEVQERRGQARGYMRAPLHCLGVGRPARRQGGTQGAAAGAGVQERPPARVGQAVLVTLKFTAAQKKRDRGAAAPPPQGRGQDPRQRGARRRCAAGRDGPDRLRPAGRSGVAFGASRLSRHANPVHVLRGGPPRRPDGGALRRVRPRGAGAPGWESLSCGTPASALSGPGHVGAP